MPLSRVLSRSDGFLKVTRYIVLGDIEPARYRAF
jgi:hypothetical protein